MSEQLWLQERPRLERWLRRSGLSVHVAEDIVLDAFEYLQREDEVTPAMLWRKALDLRVEHFRQRDKRVELDEVEPLLGGRAIPTADDIIFRADFDRAFRHLPRELAAAFALTELRGLTERETAEVLGIAQSTVNRRCEAARTLLREELS